MNKKIMVVDTETIGVAKKFCYNIGYVIAEINDNGYNVIDKREFLVKQVWRNTMLFSTAYYADKKPIYTNMLRNKAQYNNISVKRYDEIIAEMQSDIEKYNIEYVYAYNSKFDEEVFNFNCDWFKVENPLAELPFYDIRAYFMRTIEHNQFFKNYCEEYKLFTENGNYSTTAETAYRFISAEDNFIEAHTALADSEIELLILEWCNFCNVVNIFSELDAPMMLKREVEKVFYIKCKDMTYSIKGTSATWYKKKNTLTIR